MVQTAECRVSNPPAGYTRSEAATEGVVAPGGRAGDEGDEKALDTGKKAGVRYGQSEGEGRIKMVGALIARMGAVAVVALLSGCVVTEVVEVPREVPSCDVPDLQTRSKYVIEAWGVPDAQFRVGEPLTIQLRVSAPSYLTLFHVSTSCKVTRLLDNVQMPMAQIIDYPPRGGGLDITVKPPSGREGFYFIATLKELSFLSPGDILSEAGGIAKLDMDPAQFYQRLEQARARTNPSEWSLRTLRTTVVPH